jgi:D-3-phosphoglycerate dehydrogenase
MSGETILISCVQLQRSLAEHRARLDERGARLLTPPVVQQLTEADVPEIDGVVAGDDELSRTVLEHAPRLRIISKWGIGIDAIDLDAARELGIRVTNTPGVFGDEVADVALGYLLMLARQLHVIDRGVRSGGWPKPVGTSLAGRTLGVVGLGDIGLAVGRRGLAVGMRVIGVETDPDRAAAAAAAGIGVGDLDTTLREADVVSLNCPLTPATWHILNAERIGSMRPGAWIVNTARGPLIDEAALVAALESGHIAAAALDVFEVEPLPADSRLRTMDQVILGSHNGSNTAEAVHRTSVRAIDNLIRGLDEVTR